MKLKILISAIAVLCNIFISVSETWSNEEIRLASTAESVDYLTNEEKAIVMYINLARLYPQKFLNIVLSDYSRPIYMGPINRNAEYYTSLVELLGQMKPLHALYFDKYMYQMAGCWAEEMGKKGSRGHQRENCVSAKFEECCQYGYVKARDIVINLLLDEGVKNKNNRNTLLNSSLATVGVAMRNHIIYKHCTVIDIDSERLRRGTDAPSFYSSIVIPYENQD